MIVGAEVVVWLGLLLRLRYLLLAVCFGFDCFVVGLCLEFLFVLATLCLVLVLVWDSWRFGCGVILV